jgi:CHAT domain-containing protein/Tfp pilus assembly protein PilF
MEKTKRRFIPNIHSGLYLLIFLLLLFSLACETVGDRSDADQYSAETLLEKINELNGQGKYAEAIPLAQKLLAIVEKEKGLRHQGVGVSLNVLGGLYTSFGDYEKAEATLNRALEIHRKQEKEDSPVLATSMGLMSKVLMEKGEYRNAEPFAKKALQIREKIRGKDDFMVSTSLNTLGEIYLFLGDYRKAEPLLLRAIEIRQKHENAHSLVITLNNLCRLYYNSGDNESARQIGETALEIGNYALGQSHPHLAETLNLLGRIHGSRGSFKKAFEYLKQARRIDMQSFDHMKGFTSEVQKLKFVRKLEAEYHVFLSLVLQKLAGSPGALEEGMNTILTRKGMVLEVQKQFQKALLTGDEETLDLFNKLSGVRSQLARMAFSGPEQMDINRYREKMAELREVKETLEIQLSSRSRSYTLYKRKAEATCRAVSARLGNDENSALVELIKLRSYNFKSGAKKRWRGYRYFALILIPGQPYRLKVADLGHGDKTDSMISAMKTAISDLDRISNKKILTLSGRLYKTVFSPIEKKLGGRHHIYLSPDGNLNLIPFEVFFRKKGGFLIEDYTFNYVNSGRDIIGFGSPGEKGEKALIMGDPDFNLKLAGQIRGKGFRFERLPGTREEVKTIQSILGKDRVYLYVDDDAREEVLKQKMSPKILHLATHGFFLKNYRSGMGESQTSGRGLKQTSVKKITAYELKPGMSIRITNPLLQSGIVLAGANNALATADSNKSDGIVTAEEILSLQLRGTDMVVLSACNTGLGEVKAGEGVFGLRRAFSQAGARSLVMSMWSVPDKETMELMVEFYRNILTGKLNRAQALRRAALKVKQTAAERYDFANPLFWGAFIFMGEP